MAALVCIEDNRVGVLRTVLLWCTKGSSSATRLLAKYGAVLDEEVEEGDHEDADSGEQ